MTDLERVACNIARLNYLDMMVLANALAQDAYNAMLPCESPFERTSALADVLANWAKPFAETVYDDAS